MDWIETIPEWEVRAPAAYRVRNERFWRAIELPLSTESLFVVTTLADGALRTPARTIAVVTTDQLLDLLEKLGPDTVGAAYLINRSTGNEATSLEVVRLKYIESGESAGLGWRRVIRLVSDTGEAFTPASDPEHAVELTNEVVIYNFQTTD